MANKVIKLTEEEYVQHIRTVVESILSDGKTPDRVPKATKRAKNLNQQGQYTTESQGKHGSHAIIHDDAIAKANESLERAYMSLIEPFIGNQYRFYFEDRFGRVAFLTITINNLKKLLNGIAILSGDIVYDGKQMNGDIMVDFNNNRVQYTERKPRYKHNLEIDKRCSKMWNTLLKELKDSLDDRI